jgi:hypothetical protein
MLTCMSSSCIPTSARRSCMPASRLRLRASSPTTSPDLLHKKGNAMVVAVRVRGCVWEG